MEALLVSATDKFHNLTTTLADLKRDGDALWKKFNAPKEDQVWFYSEFDKVLNSRLPEHPLAKKISAEVSELNKIILEA